MRVHLSTKLPIPAEEALALVSTPELLNYVAAPLLRFVPLEPSVLPKMWHEGAYRVRVLFGGVLPLGQQTIDISFSESAADHFEMRDNGRGDLARQWDHRITIKPDGAEQCTYIDDVQISAGVLTPLVWTFAQYLYAYRQRRWRKLVSKEFGGLKTLARQAAWRQSLDAEVQAYAIARAAGDVPAQWQALERAHILSQVALPRHLQVHWLMLKLAVRLGDTREVFGQALRLALAPLGSLTGRIPWGNTGRAAANAFTPMPIPADLRDVMPH